MQVSRTMKIFLYVLTAMFLMTSPPVAWSFQGIHHHHSIIRKHKSGVVTVPLKLLYKACEDVSVRTRLLATTGTLNIENGDDFGNIRKTKHNPGKSKKVPTLLRGLEESPRREGKELQVEGDAAHSVPVVSVESKRRGRPRSGASSKLRSALSNDALLLSGADVDKEDDSVIALGNKEGKIPHLEKDKPVRARGRPRSVNSGLVSPSKGDKEDVEGEEEYGRAMHVLEPGEEDEYYFQDEDEEDLEEEGFDLEEDEEPSAERDAALPAVGRRSRRRKLAYVGVDGLPIDRDYSDEEKEWLPYIYLGGLPRQQEASVAASDGDSDCYQQVLDSHLYGHVQPAPWRVQVVSVVTNSSNNSTALECVEKIYAHIRQAFPDDPRLDFQTLCLVEGDCKPFAELEGVVQMWLEGYNTHHLVDGASMKEVWGGVVPHILLSDANLQAIVDTVAWALEESELQGTLLSPRMRNLRLRGGKPTVEGGFNTQEVESDFSTVQIR